LLCHIVKQVRKLDSFQNYWVRSVQKRMEALERRGHNLTWAKQRLQGELVEKDFTQLISLSGELDALEVFDKFLGTAVKRSDRIDFLIDNVGVEVWTPFLIKPQINLLKLIKSIWLILWKPETFHQVVYSPYSTNPVMEHTTINIRGGTIRAGAEIMIDIEGYQGALARTVISEVRRRRSKYLKTGLRGAVLVNLSYLAIANPATLEKKLFELFRPKDARTYDGILLLFHNLTPKGIQKVIKVVPNPYSSSPIFDEDLLKAGQPTAYIPRTFAFPLDLNFNRTGLHNIAERDKAGKLFLDGIPIATSLTKDANVAITGFLGKPRNIKYVEFGIEGKKWTIPLN